jgi:cation diffusion facilitator family transporter
MGEGSRRAIVAAFLANLGIALAKFCAWLATGAAAMLAEAVHSLADTGNQGLLLLGGARARRAPNPEHPFGYGAERYFWAFVVSSVLFLVGGLFAIWEGLDKLRHPHEISSPGWAIAVLLLGIVLEGFSFRTAKNASEPLRGSASWWEFIRHSKNPELPVVLLEDMGALLGLVFALVGLGLSTLLHDPRYDAASSVAIGALLCSIAAVLAVEMKSLLIGESASPRDIQAIRHALEATPRVRRLIHLRTLHIGPEQLFVGAKLELDSTLDFAGVARVINEAESGVRARVSTVELIYLEPDVHDPGQAGEGAGGGAAEEGAA